MNILISGGGTGGHIYPALALINEIKKHDSEATFLYVGTEKGLEKKIVEKQGVPFKSIDITGFKRKISFENVKTIIKFLKGVQESKKIIKSFMPDIVIGTGGFVCGPVVYAAAKMKVPTIIHEQNSVPGLTNKFLSKYVDRVAICFVEASPFFPEAKVKLTGNPRATEVADLPHSKKENLGLDPFLKTVMIVGGSRGAKPINDAVITALERFRQKDYQVLYITGEHHYDKVKEEVKKLDNPSNVIIKSFLDNMPEYLKNIELIVSRAGATTLSEINALGVPSILIPSPYVTNNHQEKNARALEQHGAAKVITETQLTSEILLKEIDEIIGNPEKWQVMSNRSRELGIPDAASKMYKLINELIYKP